MSTTPKIVIFEWDNAQGDEHNGKHLIIGQHLTQRENPEVSHMETYGISLDIIDNSKDYQLRRQSCSTVNITTRPVVITKEQARERLIQEIDLALDILYNESEISEVDRGLNIPLDNEDDDDEFDGYLTTSKGIVDY